MKTNTSIEIIGCHAEGEVGDVVIGGVEPPPGKGIWEQSRFLEENQNLKRFLLSEPRGGVFRHVNILVPPKDPRAAVGNIILEPESAPPMSGSNAMCVATVVLETGIVKMEEPETRFVIEMPGGCIDIVAVCKNGKAESIKLTNIASFADKFDVLLEVPGFGTLNVDILFGGDSFVAMDAAALGFSLKPDEARSLAEVGMRIAKAADEQIGFQHPTLKEMNDITFCLMQAPVETIAGRKVAKHAVAIKPGKIDRSPTGTAVSARLAAMHARGQAKLGDEVIFQSILGGEFTGRIEAETEIAGQKAIIPSIQGRAWVTGRRELTLDPADPWPEGYRLSDTWPKVKTAAPGPKHISTDAAVTWPAVIEAIKDGHKLPKAEIADSLLTEKQNSFLSRSAWVPGLGIGVKPVTIFPDDPAASPPKPAVQGVFVLYDDQTGALKATIDGPLITKWKTAADSVLGTQLLANPEPKNILIIGAGEVAINLAQAYDTMFPTLESKQVWARSHDKGAAFAKANGFQVAEDLEAAVKAADIIVTATSSNSPVLNGDWVKPGAHVDLVGAFRPDMRESDDALMKRGRIFVDCMETTVDHIGELMDPLKEGIITRAHILGDLYELMAGSPGRESANDITVFKNGGGAHLDLMTASVIYKMEGKF